MLASPTMGSLTLRPTHPCIGLPRPIGWRSTSQPLRQGVARLISRSQPPSCTVTCLGDSASEQQILERELVQQNAFLRRTLFGGALCLSSTLVMRPSPCTALQEYTQVLGVPIEGERFDPEQYLFEVPADWKYSSKVKRGKLLLFTDTYGPNYIYSLKWPTFSDSEGYTASRVEVFVTSSGGRDKIEELGPPENIEVGRAFGISGLELADVIASSARVDAAGVTYYNWDLDTGDDGVGLVAATISGGAIYVLNVGAEREQVTRHRAAIEHIRDSFVVLRSGGFDFDTNTRLNKRRTSGKASSQVQEL